MRRRKYWAIVLLAVLLPALLTFAVDAPPQTSLAANATYGCLDARHGNALSYWSWSNGNGASGVFTLLQTDVGEARDLLVIRGLFGRYFTGYSVVLGDLLIVTANAGETGSEDFFHTFVSLRRGTPTSFNGSVVGQQSGFQRFSARLLSCFDNLAPNPSFELAGNSPSGWRFVPGVMTGDGTWSQATRHSGRRAVELHGPLFTNVFGQCIPPHAAGHWETVAPIPIDSSHTLRLTAWHLGETLGPATGRDALRITFLNAEGATLGERSIAAITTQPGWQPGSLTVTPPYPAGTAAVRLELLVSFTVFLGPCPEGEEISNWYDDVLLLTFPGLPPPVP
jgi:hypothetical protein